MLEDEVSQLIRLEAPKENCHLFRNNSGAFTYSTGRSVRFGLGNDSKKISDKLKSSDWIGITTVVITPDMVGKKIGVFTAIECKREGWNPKNLDARETAQKNFIDFIIARGGIGGFASSAVMFCDVVKEFLLRVKNI